ncbi:Asx homology domain-containing protein [Boeremia exigua]|uniref:Asx homology domain-containing protein n=1 Tax=Boeremia exigua TaxID=749465 RepID=UPI001E8D6A57|nr:Asx homology domain-containing protein [Boeremia exigua]KAH6642499.1 Asx homology domain-containing protein [Boeremia exigua]
MSANIVSGPSTSTIPQESDPSTNGDHTHETTMTTLPDESLAAMPNASDNSVPKRSSKRSRVEDGDEKDTSPVPKKPAREPEPEPELTVKTSPAGGESPNGTTAGDNERKEDETIRPKTPELQSTRNAKPVLKRAVAKPSRGRACATCKKRKVKCRHSATGDEDGTETTGDEDGTETTALKQSGMAGGIDEVEEASEAVQTSTARQASKKVEDVNDGAATLEASTKKSKATKKATPKKIRAPPERISTRNRKAPERLDDVQEQLPSRSMPAKKTSSKVFDPVYITTNSTSRLGKADMYHMLTEDETAWSSLSAEQQTKLVSMLPDTAENQQLIERIQAGATEDTRPQYLRASDVFRTEVAKFQADLKNGHLAKTWQATAAQAVAERANGENDAWKAEEAELWWGQKSK